MISGHIIYVCGLYGAGKTTLVKAALDAIPHLKCVPTYVTRAPRPSEVNSNYEYTFVSVAEYNRLRQSSARWDHTEVAGVYYGTPVDPVNEQLNSGKDYIISSPIAVDQLNEMKAYYTGKSSLVFIDTPLETANQRLLDRDGGNSRSRISDPTQSTACAVKSKRNSDVVFTPSGALEKDQERFIELVQGIIAGE